MFTTTLQKTIAEKIEAHLAAKKITRKDLIEALDMGYQAFERRMSGELQFGLGELWTIAEVLRTSPLSLMPEDADETPVKAVA